MVASSSLEDTYVGLAPEEYTKKIIIILNVIIDKQFINSLISYYSFIRKLSHSNQCKGLAVV